MKLPDVAFLLDEVMFCEPRDFKYFNHDLEVECMEGYKFQLVFPEVFSLK